MVVNRIEITVHWGDCDPAEIVFYPNFFRWFDCGTTELFASVGLDLSTLFREHDVLGIPILDAGARFKRPARFRDRLGLETRIAEWARSSFRVEHRITKDNEETATGHEVRAWVARDPHRPDGLRALPVPEAVRRRFETES